MGAQNRGIKSTASSSIETELFSCFSPKFISSRCELFIWHWTLCIKKKCERKNEEIDFSLYFWGIRLMIEGNVSHFEKNVDLWFIINDQMNMNFMGDIVFCFKRQIIKETYPLNMSVTVLTLLMVLCFCSSSKFNTNCWW
jgi:hypothetical protein